MMRFLVTLFFSLIFVTDAFAIITYNQEIVSYMQLLDIFWRQIDPTDTGGQFADRGPHYQTAIFVHTSEQEQAAQSSKDQLNQSQKFDKPIVTKVIKAGQFYPAEDYHHEYYLKNPDHYNQYKYFSGRSQFLDSKWRDN